MGATELQLAALEARFAALEAKYNEVLGQKALPSIDTKTSGVITTDVKSPTLNGTPTPLTSISDKKDDATKLATESNATTKSRAKILLNAIDKKTGERKDQESTDAADTQKADQAFAFTLRKYLHEDSEDNYGELEITSRPLWNLLRRELREYPHHFFPEAPTTLSTPFETMIHSWDKLQDLASTDHDDETEKRARADLRVLLDIITAGSGCPKLDRLLKNRHSNKEQQVVTFETLWTAFPPGTLIYGKPFQNQEQVFVVQDNTGCFPYIEGKRDRSFWNLLAWTYDTNGDYFRRLLLRLRFDYFDGPKPITSLPFFPVDLMSDRTGLDERLIERGRRYRHICATATASRLYEYRGDAILSMRGFSGVQTEDNTDDDLLTQSYDEGDYHFRRRLDRSRQPTKSDKIESRVMVDFESYFQYGPLNASVGDLPQSNTNYDCECNDCHQNTALRNKWRIEYDEDKHPRPQKDWCNEQYMLCPPRLLGYVLKDKRWGQLQIDLLKDIDQHPSAASLSRLQLADGDKTKKMLLDVVKGHGITEDSGLQVDDIVAKKGKGLVILLYGPPGVGKTSTAEVIAEVARKPLFSISVADVGTNAKHVEANLARIFALAASWQAILLIDEADVFLESRGTGLASNTERNALVSVFLRVLEYYKGILMLTTNQIAQFDVAVHSRIHIAIRYNKLNADQTLAIFENFLKPLRREGLIQDWDSIMDYITDDVISMGLDGRQIRNVITTSLSIARAKKAEKLSKTHIKAMVTNVKDFKLEFITQYEQYRSNQGFNKN